MYFIMTGGRPPRPPSPVRPPRPRPHPPLTTTTPTSTHHYILQEPRFSEFGCHLAYFCVVCGVASPADLLQDPQASVWQTTEGANEVCARQLKGRVPSFHHDGC
ncbi:hypothetical protein E2C01_007064 [Portunus trituberculatus]|uniref:Uncharacterized protein n=1 Tax=Portunus trituberculatus TaxID=210409 RepID=A0A5B7CY57_PORTR|nr:hypothetical protein [Portunus trituberculatus]